MIEQLLESDILIESGDGHYEPSPEFLENVADRAVSAGSDSIETVQQEEPTNRDYVAFLEEREEYLAIYLTIDEQVEGIDHFEKLQAVCLVLALRRPGEQLDGVPEFFFPVPGDLLGHLVGYYERAIVYVWRDNCPPCETVKSDFEIIFDAPPDDIALLSVYGPDWASLLDREYDVAGGPTTLFMVNGKVDARLVGAHPRKALTTEIEILREQT